MCVGAFLAVLGYDPAANEKVGGSMDDGGMEGRIIESERLYRAMKLLNGTQKIFFYSRAINEIL